MLLCRVLPVQVAQMIDGEGVDDPLLSEVWWDDVLPWPIAASWSSLIVIFGVMREVRQ
jgi:hypothetical protein